MKKVFSRIIVLVLCVTLAMGIIPAQAAPEYVKIAIDEWVGNWTLLAANGGLRTTPDSANAKRGIYIDYQVMNEGDLSSAAMISGEIVGAIYTVNRYAYLQDRFDKAGVAVVVPFITNYSNGGDGIICKADITSVKDLVGRKIGVPRFSEAQTLVEWLLNKSSLSETEKKQIHDDMVYFESAEDTGNAYFSGALDAAATWEPFLSMATTATDSRVLFSTAMATDLVMNAMVFRKDFVDSHEDFMLNLIDAALECMPAYKTDFASIRQMAVFETMSDEEIVDMASGADLAGCAQNVQLLSEGAAIVYRDMANVWIGLGEVAYPEKAETAFTDRFVRKLLDKYPDNSNSDSMGLTSEEKVRMMESPEALLSFSADIKFDLNSTEIKSESKAKLDEFVAVAKMLSGVYIQIEGNAAKRNVGVTDEQITDFSKERAQAVADYFIKNGISADRILVKGNGDFNPLNKENLAAPENRRTEFFL